MAKEFEHSDPNHLNPTQAREYALQLGLTDNEIDSAEAAENPMPGVFFDDGKPRPFAVYHREDIENWANSLKNS